MAAPLGRAQDFQDAGRLRPAEVLHPRHVPYPSGTGLHVGHPEGYTATDILARYRRMSGFNVLHPMGWDAFGLPAEQYAIKTGTHPRITTEKNIDTFRRQTKCSASVTTGTARSTPPIPAYFKWTQWIFLQLFDTWYDAAQQRGRPLAELPIPPAVQAAGRRGVRMLPGQERLAYQAEVPVNWCPALGTVLANEEVIDGKSSAAAFRGPYAAAAMDAAHHGLCRAMLADLEQVDWSRAIKEMQRNWIGRSDGAEVDFTLAPAERGVNPPMTSCASSPHGPTRSSAPPTWCWRRSIRWWRGSPHPNSGLP